MEQSKIFLDAIASLDMGYEREGVSPCHQPIVLSVTIVRCYHIY